MVLDLTDPMAMAGLAVMSGKPLSDAMVEAAKMNIQKQQAAAQASLWEAQKQDTLSQMRMRDMQLQQGQQGMQMMNSYFGGGQQQQQSQLPMGSLASDPNQGVGGNPAPPIPPVNTGDPMAMGGMSMPAQPQMSTPQPQMSPIPNTQMNPQQAAGAYIEGKYADVGNKLADINWQQKKELMQPAIEGAKTNAQEEAKNRQTFIQKGAIAQSVQPDINKAIDTVKNAPEGTWKIAPVVSGITQGFGRYNNTPEQASRDKLISQVSLALDKVAKTQLGESALVPGSTRLTDSMIQLTKGSFLVDDLKDLATLPKETLLNVLNNVNDTMQGQVQASNKLNANKNTTMGDFLSQGNPFQTTPQRISVVTPDGKMGTIDASHVQDLIKSGGRVAQ